jgi:hypothetical protein
VAASDFAQVQVRGARKLTRAMRQAGVELDDLKAANMAVGGIVLSAANPPRRTGRLAASGRVGRARSRARITYSRPYAPPIHWGWPARNIEANPWLAMAAKVTELAWLRVYLAALDDIVNQVEASTS